jgi:hypothetical protein
MATTIKQLTANRKNAARSTGPKTATGKMISSRNSTKHGFYSTAVVLPNEDHEEFLVLARRFVSAYKPCGLQEEELVRSIIETTWRLRRMGLVESQLFQMYGHYKAEDRGVGTAFAQDAVQGNAFSKLAGYEASLLKKLYRAQDALGRLKSETLKALNPAQTAMLLPGHITEQSCTPLLECAAPATPISIPNSSRIGVRAR